MNRSQAGRKLFLIFNSPPRCELFRDKLERLALMVQRFNNLGEFLEQRFGLSGSISRIDGGLSHEVYILKNSSAEIIVKVYETSISLSRLEAEEFALGLAAYSNKIVAPKLIRGISNQYRESFNGSQVSCYPKISGVRRFSLIDAPGVEEDIYEIGRYLGELHSALNADTEPSQRNKRHQSGLLTYFLQLEEKSGIKVSEIELELRDCKAPVWLIHGDFQPGNLLYLEDKITGVVDFEYSTFDFRAFELAGTVSNLLSGNAELEVNRCIDWFCSGYEATALLPLMNLEKKHLKNFIRLTWFLNEMWVESSLSSGKEFDKGSLDTLNTYLKQTRARLISD